MKKTLPLLCVMLCALLLTQSACSGPPAPSASAAPVTEITVTADRTGQVLTYGMDTLINYTVTTPPDCDLLFFGIKTTSMDFYTDMVEKGPEYVEQMRQQDPEYYVDSANEQYFFLDEADVTTTDSSRVWRLPIDFGYTGVYGVRVRAMANEREYLGYGEVYIRYPQYNIYADGIYKVWEDYIVTNSTDPFRFLVDLSQSGLDYMHNSIDNWIYYMYASDSNSTLCISLSPEEREDRKNRFGIEYKNPWDAWMSANTPVYGETALVRPSASTLSAGAVSYTGGTWADATVPPYGDYLVGEISGEGTTSEYIFDGTRAAVCYRKGVAVDAAKFPEAAYIYERGSQILAQILTDGMNDFEKVKAIHDWMLADGKNHTRSGEYEKLSAEEQMWHDQSCIGFLRGYGGDCMGWSDTFRVLCGMAGVACSGVSAIAQAGGAVKTLNGVNHSFNVAMLDGEPYYFDVYWDGAGSGYDSAPYTYFAMTSKAAAKHHTWLAYDSWGPPEATSVKYKTNPNTGEPVK